MGENYSFCKLCEKETSDKNIENVLLIYNDHIDERQGKFFSKIIKTCNECCKNLDSGKR